MMGFGSSGPDFDPAINALHATKARGDLDRRLPLLVVQYGAGENNRIIDESDLNIGGVHVTGFCERIRNPVFEPCSSARVFWFECFTVESWGLENHGHTSLLFTSNAQTGSLFSGGHE